MSVIWTINPSTEERIQDYELLEEKRVEECLSRSHRAFRSWSRSSFEERSKTLKAVAQNLRNKKTGFAWLMTQEMGKPITQAESEVEKCAWVCDYYAENAEAFLQDKPIETENATSRLVFEPLGSIFAIMPWNFPFWQVLRFAAPTLMAGNSVLLKHSENVSGCAQAIETLFEESGLPTDTFINLRIDHQMAEKVIRSETVRGVSLTGSEGAGRKVAAIAGESLKPSVLELGGSDPYLVLEDADLDLAAEKLVTSRLINSGQSCIAAKRFIVSNSVKTDFENLVVLKMKERTIGDPFKPTTDIGPLARADLRDELAKQVKDSLAAGAKVLLGAEPSKDKGYFYPATVLSNVQSGMPAFEDELFGPVASVMGFDEEDEAIELANGTRFGLGAGVFSKDEIGAQTIATKKLEAGACFINDFVRSDPRLPFGGVKSSGYGRELGEFGIFEFTNIKTLVG